MSHGSCLPGTPPMQRQARPSQPEVLVKLNSEGVLPCPDGHQLDQRWTMDSWSSRRAQLKHPCNSYRILKTCKALLRTYNHAAGLCQAGTGASFGMHDHLSGLKLCLMNRCWSTCSAGHQYDCHDCSCDNAHVSEPDRSFHAGPFWSVA